MRALRCGKTAGLGQHGRQDQKKKVQPTHPPRMVVTEMIPNFYSYFKQELLLCSPCSFCDGFWIEFGLFIPEEFWL